MIRVAINHSHHHAINSSSKLSLNHIEDLGWAVLVHHRDPQTGLSDVDSSWKRFPALGRTSVFQFVKDIAAGDHSDTAVILDHLKEVRTSYMTMEDRKPVTVPTRYQLVRGDKTYVPPSTHFFALAQCYPCS